MSHTRKPINHLLPEEKRKLLAQLLLKKVNKSQFPLSFAQQRLWFLAQLQPSSVYNIPAALRLTGLLNTAALLQSLNEIVRRHEILRITFTARMVNHSSASPPP